MNYNEYELDESIKLLKSIGFKDEDKIKIILQEYENKFGYIDYEYTTRERRNRKGQKTFTNYFQKVYKNDICIKYLKLEFNLKSNHNEVIKKENKNEKISATDIANYIYCPACYSISNSFKIEHSINQNKKTNGTKLHDELKLIYDKKEFGNITKLKDILFDHKDIISKIKKCKSIYIGSNSNSKVFYNDSLQYIGKPDYIFLDPNNDFFVVEEKFHLLNSKSKRDYTEFYTNNLIQLQSYIEYINEIDIKYGVLIVWDYIINNDQLLTLNFKHKIIKKGIDKKFLDKTYNEIIQFKKNIKIPFKNNINLNKCLNCSVSLYCSHKTGKYNYLEFPYNLNHLKIIDENKDNNNLLQEAK